MGIWSSRAAVAGDHVGAVGVGGRLHGDHVARVDEQLAGQIESLHPPGGDQELLGRGRRAVLTLEELEQRRAQTGLALCRAVVEHVGCVRVEYLLGDRGELGARHRLGAGAAHRHPHDVVRLALQQAGAAVDRGPVDAGGASGEPRPADLVLGHQRVSPVVGHLSPPFWSDPSRAQPAPTRSRRTSWSGTPRGPRGRPRGRSQTA